MKNQVVSVTEFKAKCLALLDEVGAHGGTLTITKRGRPLASVGPMPRAAWKSPEGIWEGRVTIPDELLDPNADSSDLWEVVNQGEGSML